MFGIVAVALGIILIQLPATRAGAVSPCGPPVVSVIAWFSFFYAIYGTPNPAAPYNGYTQSEVGNLARGVPGLLFDQQFGLLPNAPVYLCAILGFWTLLRRRLFVALATLLVVVPYATAVAMYAIARTMRF